MNQRTSKLVGIAAIIVGSVPLGMSVGVGSASAATDSAAQVTVACTHVSGDPETLVGSLSGCTMGATGGKGKLSDFRPSGGKVAWANGTKTTYTSTITESGTLCPSTSLDEFNVKGSVKSSTNAAIPVGAKVKMTLCVASATKMANAPGTRATF